MKNGTIKERDKAKIHILVSNCPSKTVGEEESKERREEEEEEGRGEEEDQNSGMFLPWNHGYLDS